jgi:2-polyprenyl-3-methyl-5-hydroxy-6-metoxy-1,4-benzoquinol methylase
VTSAYKFENVPACNMCGHPSAKNKVLGVRLNTSQGFKPRSETGIAVTVIRCKNCMLIYSNPLPIPMDIQAHYGVPADEYWGTQDFEFCESYFSNGIQKAKELLSFKPGMKALDIGAGFGRAMVALSSAGFDTYGLEPSVLFREKALDQIGIDPKRLKLGMLEEIEYPNEEFDFITFGAVLEHLYDPNSAIRKSLTWLKKGGILHFEVPSSDWFENGRVIMYQ